jgi:hypothetical protein
MLQAKFEANSAKSSRRRAKSPRTDLRLLVICVRLTPIPLYQGGMLITNLSSRQDDLGKPPVAAIALLVNLIRGPEGTANRR